MELVKQEDRLHRYRAHILQGRSLSDDEHRILARYRKAWALLAMGYSRLQVVTTMKSDPHDTVSESQLYNVIRDAKTLMGNLEEVDKKAERWIAYENYKLLANLARKEGNIGAAIRAQELADKILGLFEPDVVGLNPKDFLRPTAIVFTTDIQALKDAAAAEEAEDVDYEEAE